jgi:thioredoxin-like negative regulator of GroEL|tara:strand:- start:405 stop:656 length:252 start_codon:yes stop_codon:yes gene_type:complete
MNKLIYISATWCGPCKTFGPVMNQVAESGIPVTKVDADRDQQALVDFQVRSVPAVVKVDESGKMLDKFIGVKSMQEVLNFYNG